MTHKKTVVFLICSFLCFSQSFAQNEIDALRYGMTSQGVTARSIGLGGAGGSYGADFSSLSINPAGIGVYRHSKLTISPGLRIDNANSDYLGNSTKDQNSKFNLSNIGAVFTHSAQGREYEQSDWKAYSIGIGYSRLADFNSAITYSGSNNQSSLTDVMSQDAINNGIGQDLVPPLGYLGYQSFLLYDDYSSIPQTNILDNGGSVFQNKSMESSGGIGAWTFSFGGNYMEKLMLGASLDMVSYKYNRDSYFDESDETGDTDNDFDFLNYHEGLSTTGLGFDLKMGAIYVVNDHFRVGLAFHTPTWSTFSDVASYDLISNTENLKYRTAQASTDPLTNVKTDKDYSFAYNLRTPWKGLLSATVFLGSHGFITADYSYVDYASMRYNFGKGYGNYEHQINQAIKDTYQGSNMLNIGIEGKEKAFFGRLGFGYQSSPFKRSADFGGERIDFTAGLGMHFDAISIDLGYRHRILKSGEYAYPLLASGVITGLAETQQNKNLIALTLGYQF